MRTRAARGSGRRVTNGELKIKKPPHAYAFFLTHMKTMAHRLDGRRLRCKTCVLRADLMSQKFRFLSSSARQPYLDKAEKALAATRSLRQTLLQARKSQSAKPNIAASVVTETAPASVVTEMAPASVVTETAPASVITKTAPQSVSSAEPLSTLWLRLDLPSTTPVFRYDDTPSCTPHEACISPAATISQDIVWVEKQSGIRHELQLGDGSSACQNLLDHGVGHGSYGVCHQVTDRSTGERFCVKLPQAGSSADVCRLSLREEYQALMKLHHPNIIQPLSLITLDDDSVHSLLMPLFELNLWQWLAAMSPESGPNDVNRSVCLQLLRGMAYMHAAHVVHLDLKPENMLLSSTRRCANIIRVLGETETQHMHACLADFGQCQPGGTATGQPRSFIQSHFVNSELYRPLPIRNKSSVRVPVRYHFDRWAMGCMVFDMFQVSPPRLSSTGTRLRLFDGISSKLDLPTAWRHRNFVLKKFALPEVIAFIVACQPDPPSATDLGSSFSLLKLGEKLCSRPA